MTRFADFWRGMFYMTATIVLGVVLYLLVVVWQPLWTLGFEDFGKISGAIERLDETTKPAAELVPQMLGQMQVMNKQIGEMSDSVRAMKGSVSDMSLNLQHMDVSMQALDTNMYYMRGIMGQQMGIMNYQMDKMNDKFTPMGMMPFNW
ncbi:MAG: hypothetical protein R3F02_00210 [Thiolinea sp.]